MLYIFDLDHTVIDSSHRQLTKADGSLDLSHWIENSTREKIMADTLLPLAEVMRDVYARGDFVLICTARTCSQHDLGYLSENNLPYHDILYRGIGDNRPDAQYKSEKLAEWAEKTNQPIDWRRKAVMFDDNVNVIKQMIAERLPCLDAIRYNKGLAA